MSRKGFDPSRTCLDEAAHVAEPKETDLTQRTVGGFPTTPFHTSVACPPQPAAAGVLYSPRQYLLQPLSPRAAMDPDFTPATFSWLDSCLIKPRAWKSSCPPCASTRKYPGTRRLAKQENEGRLEWGKRKDTGHAQSTSAAHEHKDRPAVLPHAPGCGDTTLQQLPYSVVSSLLIRGHHPSTALQTVAAIPFGPSHKPQQCKMNEPEEAAHR